MIKSFGNFLKELVENWKLAMRQYIKNSKNDLPYWHNERANTSFLAAAAWRMGAVAIEEYYAERGKRKSKGRCDLWVKYGKFCFSAEAKQLWSARYSKKIIGRQLNKAEDQLRDIRDRPKGESSVCLCFLSPRIKDYENKELINKFIKNIKRDFKSKDTIIEEYFPKININRLIWKEEKYKYPGVILLLKMF